MDNRHRYTEPAAEPRGIAGDIHRLRTHGGASAAELRDFVGRMHGKSPQEVLGTVAGSSLVRCMVLSTLAFAVLLTAFTVGPWLMDDPDAEKQATVAEAAQPAAAGPADQAAAAPAADSDAAAVSAPTAEPDATASNGQKAVDALGIGETITADPKTNPLESNLDKLLDGID